MVSGLNSSKRLPVEFRISFMRRSPDLLSPVAQRWRALHRVDYELIADFMRRCKGKVMVSINDHPDIRRVFEDFHFVTVDIRYSTSNHRQGTIDVSGELAIMNCVPELLGGLF
jgi:hypothetical protein